MKISQQRRRMLVAVLAAALVAGLAAGLVLARDDSGRALAQGPPRVIAEGEFRSLTWGTEGTASLVREPSGKLKLRLSRSFLTKRTPELYVYLAKLRGRQRVFWKPVGLLRRAWGRQEYDVSSEAAKIPGISVAIYCGECNQVAAVAPLERAATRSSARLPSAQR